jgi:hypothetical protein
LWNKDENMHLPSKHTWSLSPKCVVHHVKLMLWQKHMYPQMHDV